MNAITIVSLFAAALSMISYVPQAWNIIRSRSSDAISLRMYIITVTGFATWLIYGILKGQWAIITQNVVCLSLSAFILTMKLLPEHKTKDVADTMAPKVGADGR